MKKDDAGGPSGGVALFERHDVEGETICAQGEAISRTGRGFSDVADGIRSSHSRAVDGVDGDIEAPMAAAAPPVIAQGERLNRLVTVGGGAVVMFGNAVSEFDDLVDRFNAQITAEKTPEDKQAKKAALAGRFHSAEAELEQVATDAAKALRKPESPHHIRMLWNAGALPAAARSMFPDLGLKASDAIPYDIANGPTPRLVDYLKKHPKLLKDRDAMDQVRDRIAELDGEDGSRDADGAADAAAEKDGTGLRDHLANAALITLYAKHAQDRGDAGKPVRLPPGATNYLRSFNDRVLDDGLKTATAINKAASQHGGSWTKSAVGNALLAASDESLHADGKGTLPSTVSEALRDLPRHQVSDDLEHEIVGGEGYLALTSLLGTTGHGRDLQTVLDPTSPALEAGRGLSAALTESTADLVRALDRIDPVLGGGMPIDPDGLAKLERLQDAGVDTMGVASRNEQANVDLLERANHSADGAKDLLTLYRHDWGDDGDAVAGYTDWIGRDLDRSHADDPAWEHRRDLATKASADFIDLATETGTERGSDNGRINVFAQLMGRDVDGKGDHGPSVGVINPELAKSFADVAGANLDAMGDDPTYNATSIGDDGTLRIAEDDRGRLFTLANTHADGAERLNTQVGAYQGELLRDAIRSGDDGDLAAAGRVNGRLEGYARAGDINAHLIADRLGYEDDMGDYKDARNLAGIAKDTVLGAYGKTPPGALTTPVLGHLGDAAIDDLLDKPKDPAAHYVGDASDEDALATRGVYDYLRAYEQVHGTLPDDAGRFAGPDGKLRDWDADLKRELLQDYARESGAGAYIGEGGYRPAGRYDEAALSPKGSNHVEDVEGYLDGRL